MRHRKDKLKLSRPRSQRKALKDLLVRNLILQEKIKTTLAKAKVAARFTERLISLAKKDDLSSRRRAYAVLKDHSLVKRLFSDIAPRFKNIKGGYTRILKLNHRKGDGAPLALVELVSVAIPESQAKPSKPAESQRETPAGEKKRKPREEKTKVRKKGLGRLFKK